MCKFCIKVLCLGLIIPISSCKTNVGANKQIAADRAENGNK